MVYLDLEVLYHFFTNFFAQNMELSVTGKIMIALLTLVNDKIFRLYEKKNYSKILRLTKGFYGNLDRPSLYRNVFRVLALFHLGYEEWEDGDGLILTSDQFQLLNDDENTYLRKFLLKNLIGYIEEPLKSHSIKTDNVSSKLLGYFPLEHD